MLTKQQIITYLIDVTGYSEQEATEEYAEYGKEVLTSEQKKECIAWWK